MQPRHSPPVEALIKGTVKEVLEGRIIEPQPLYCTTELQGKPTDICPPLTEGAQGLELEDVLVEGAGEGGGRRKPFQGLSGWVEWMRARTQLQEEKGFI